MGHPTDKHPLRIWRKAANLTLAQAAEQVGTSRQVWSDWERGRRRPNQSFMPKVVALTGRQVTADDFFCELAVAAASQLEAA